MMLRKLVKDESGIAMGLTVVMIVLIGVMGAGLLVFVRNDLMAVVEVNRGQKAFEIADAGVEAARRQLLADSKRQHYDMDHTNDCTSEPRLGDDWSPSTTVYENPDCSGAEITRDPPGVTKNFAGGKFNVTIQCLNQNADPSPSPCAGVAENAPEVVEADKEAFFRIVSTGYYPEDGSGAKRKIEAFMHTTDAGVPQAYYTPGDIDFSGTVNISGVSFFSQGNITGIDSGNVTVDRGPDTPYGNWVTDYNSEPRTNNVEGAGFAAEGLVCGGNQCDDPSDSAADNEYDYDSATTKEFYRKAEADLKDTNDSGKITYPFDPYKSYDLDLLKDIAKNQSGNSDDGDNHFVVAGSSGIGEHDSNEDVKYPEVSTSGTVVYIEANGNNVTYKVNTDPDPMGEGIVVIEGGNLKMGNSSNGFNGAFIITSGGGAPGDYDSAGQGKLNGFVVADGTMNISGDTDTYTAAEGFTRQPGNYNVDLWSWRECYSDTCS